MYEGKATALGKVDKTLYKSLLNNFLGRFGMNIDRTKTDLLTPDQLSVVLYTREVKNVVEMSDYTTLTTYVPDVSKEISRTYNKDFIDALNNHVIPSNLLENPGKF